MGFLSRLWRGRSSRQQQQIEASIESVKQRLGEKVDQAEREHAIAVEANISASRRRTAAVSPLMRVLAETIRLQQQAHHERHHI